MLDRRTLPWLNPLTCSFQKFPGGLIQEGAKRACYTLELKCEKAECLQIALPRGPVEA